MKLEELQYVDKAEKAIVSLQKPDFRGQMRMPLTTSKIRGLLSLVSALYTDAQHEKGDTLTEEMQGRVQYLRMRIAYEAGRDNNVKDFVTKAELLPCVAEVGESRKRLLLFCRYMEALVAYHKFYGGTD